MNEYKTLITEADMPFYFTVYATSREAEMASWGWSPEEQRAFLRMQYQSQQHSYQSQYPDLESRTIFSGDIPAGRLLLAKTETGKVLVDISILPEFQNRGIGSAILKALQTETPAGESLRLSVLTTNPARRLYERLGFQVQDVGDVYLAMMWHKS